MPRNPIHRARFLRARHEANVIAVAGREAAPEALQTDAAPLAEVRMPPPANAAAPSPALSSALSSAPSPALSAVLSAVLSSALSPATGPVAADDSALSGPTPAATLLQSPAGATAVKPLRKAAGRARGGATGPLDGRDRHGRGLPNLTDLADRYGSDKGSAKHRYTELYNMLFQPRRDDPIQFLEMGLQIGGPELGHDQDRATTDLPSVRMWLEFFTKAQIWGLDVSDFSWFSHERFQFVRCDMDARANIAAAAAGMPPMDIMIDDASHASHHQQNAFLELFPRLNDGGLYIIEDLRWQPEAYERKGITKTAELFQSYVQTGVFRHSDPALADAFNALRLDMSGCFLHQVHFVKARRDQVLVVHKR